MLGQAAGQFDMRDGPLQAQFFGHQFGRVVDIVQIIAVAIKPVAHRLDGPRGIGQRFDLVAVRQGVGIRHVVQRLNREAFMQTHQCGSNAGGRLQHSLDHCPWQPAGLQGGVLEGCLSALMDRRVEISGPVDRKGMIAAFYSGANVYVANFEDSTAPSFGNIVAGLNNLIDHRDGVLEVETPEGVQRVGPYCAILMVRPRGLHLQEANVLIGG